MSYPTLNIDDRTQRVILYVKNITSCPQTLLKVIKQKTSRFMSEFKAKIKAAQYKKDRFITENSKWLEGTITFPMFLQSSNKCKPRIGRPTNDFLHSSERTKRNKTKLIRSTMSSAELTYAAQMSLRAEGSVDAAAIVKEVKFSTPTRASKYRQAFKRREGESLYLSEDKALSVLIEAKLTRHQYNIIREADKKKFPSYKKIQEAKKRCYPSKEHMQINGKVAEVKLQALLDHTVKRIVEVQQEVLHSVTENDDIRLTLISKWGCDGTSGQSQYKQKYNYDEEFDDASIFITSFVPLRLIYETPEKHIVIWQNPRTSSPRFCRPIRIQFIHETPVIIVREKTYIENQIKELQATNINLGGKLLNISHSLLFTMIDGKICNAASSTTSTQKCYICGAT